MPIQAPPWADYLNCPVCSNEYSLNHRSPISLGCSHTICRPCLGRCRQCPLDQTPINYDIDSLPINYALLQLLNNNGNNNNNNNLNGTRNRCTTISASARRLRLEDLELYKISKKCIETVALQLKTPIDNGNYGSVLSRPMQRKVIALVNCQLLEEEGRLRALRAARILGERSVTEIILQYQNQQQLGSNVWAAVRSRGCQFLGPAMQEEVLKLVLLALEDGTAMSRKELVMFVVQRLEKHFPTASKTSIGHVVQLLYRASCFKVSKREADSSLMQLKDEFRSYESLRREHDAQIVQIATEASLRIAPEQWSMLLYGDGFYKSHMQSIIDKLQISVSFEQSVQELLSILQRNGDPTYSTVLRHLKLLSSIDLNIEKGSVCWEELSKALRAVEVVILALVQLIQNHENRKQHDNNVGQGLPCNHRYKVSFCRDLYVRGLCPRGDNCTFAHTGKELDHYRSKNKMKNNISKARMLTSPANSEAKELIASVNTIKSGQQQQRSLQPNLPNQKLSNWPQSVAVDRSNQSIYQVSNNSMLSREFPMHPSSVALPTSYYNMHSPIPAAPQMPTFGNVHSNAMLSSPPTQNYSYSNVSASLPTSPSISSAHTYINSPKYAVNNASFRNSSQAEQLDSNFKYRDFVRSPIMFNNTNANNNSQYNTNANTSNNNSNNGNAFGSMTSTPNDRWLRYKTRHASSPPTLEFPTLLPVMHSGYTSPKNVAVMPYKRKIPKVGCNIFMDSGIDTRTALSDEVAQLNISNNSKDNNVGPIQGMRKVDPIHNAIKFPAANGCATNHLLWNLHDTNNSSFDNSSNCNSNSNNTSHSNSSLSVGIDTAAPLRFNERDNFLRSDSILNDDTSTYDVPTTDEALGNKFGPICPIRKDQHQHQQQQQQEHREQHETKIRPNEKWNTINLPKDLTPHKNDYCVFNDNLNFSSNNLSKSLENLKAELWPSVKAAVEKPLFGSYTSNASHGNDAFEIKENKNLAWKSKQHEHRSNSHISADVVNNNKHYYNNNTNNNKNYNDMGRINNSSNNINNNNNNNTQTVKTHRRTRICTSDKLTKEVMAQKQQQKLKEIQEKKLQLMQQQEIQQLQIKQLERFEQSIKQKADGSGIINSGMMRDIELELSHIVDKS